MMTLYQRRGTGKSRYLVIESNRTGLPIATYSEAAVEYLMWLAENELHLVIPRPFVASPEACNEAKEYLVDEGSLILQNLLGGKIVLMTITDEGNQEFKDYMDGYVAKG